MSKRKDLPIIIGKNLSKGCLGLPENDGYSVWIVWLKEDKEYVSGEPFELEDIENANAILHFCDKSSIEVMIGVLQKGLEIVEK